MSGSVGIAGIAGSPSGLSAVIARVTELDARLRAVDATWQGLGTLGAADLPASSSVGGSFADTLDAQALADPAGSTVGASSLSSAAVAVDDAFLMPVEGARVSQSFGPTTLEIEPPAVIDGTRYAHFHDGLDLAAPLGTAVRAAAAGVVVAAGRQSDGAVVVRIRHADGSETSYGHLEAGLDVVPGDRVAAGQVIGAIGLTGRTTGPHLHFELIQDGRAVDPAPSLAAGRLPGSTAETGVDADAPADVSITALSAFDAVSGQIPYAGQIRDAAIKAGVDPLLLASLVRAESGFRADAVSPAGALGLAQLMPANVRSLRVGDPFDPAQNVTAAARYFANNLRIYGRTDVALAAYQAGKGSVARAGGVPDSPTTHRYIDRILGFWSGYLDAGARAEAAR